ncbi:unnamed protein product [Rotaria sp. Silwood1]|nr:unnamed protein product [Rotaria sp. Silwood1]
MLLLIFLVYEICENGKRTLFHHDQRRFTTEDKRKTNQLTSSINTQTASGPDDRNNFGREPEILLLTDEMFSEQGKDLDLKLTVIPQTKTRCKNARSLFCGLKNEYPISTTYETTRLACLLVLDDEVLWDYLLLSKAMIFSKSSDNIGDIEIKDGNNIFIEQIPGQLYKRKRNLNQSQTVNIRPRKGKKVPQTMEHTEVSNSKVNQHQQTQLMHVSSEHQTSLSMPTTEQLQQSAYVPISQCYLLTPVHSMTTGFLDAQVSFFDESSFSVKN